MKLCFWFILSAALSVVFGRAAIQPPDAVLVKQRALVVQLGDAIWIGAFGDFGKAITNQLATDNASTRPNLKLYLNSVAMAGLQPAILPPQAFGPLPQNDDKP